MHSMYLLNRWTSPVHSGGTEGRGQFGLPGERAHLLQPQFSGRRYLRISVRYTTAVRRSLSRILSFSANKFCVEDGIESADSAEEAMETLANAGKILDDCNIHLHKTFSSSQEVLPSFPPSELSSQSALGVTWEIQSNRLTLKYQAIERKIMRRAVLSQKGSIFDP